MNNTRRQQILDAACVIALSLHQETPTHDLVAAYDQILGEGAGDILANTHGHVVLADALCSLAAGQLVSLKGFQPPTPESISMPEPETGAEVQVVWGEGPLPIAVILAVIAAYEAGGRLRACACGQIYVGCGGTCKQCAAAAREIQQAARMWRRRHPKATAAELAAWQSRYAARKAELNFK